MPISKGEIYAEFDSLIEEGKRVLKTSQRDRNGICYVDYGKFKSWQTKIIVFLKAIIPSDNFHIQNIVEQPSNKSVYAENCLLSFGNVKEQLEKGYIPFAPQNISEPLHDEMQPPKILISHSSDDKEICDMFVNFLNSIGFSNETLIYTSKAEYAVPLGKNIFDYLRDNLDSKIWVFFMLSKNFYKSPACLNEMGAVWVKQSKYFAVLLPGFNYEEMKGAINPSEPFFDLTDAVRLTELLGIFRETWKLSINETMWTSVQSDFVERMKSIYSAKTN